MFLTEGNCPYYTISDGAVRIAESLDEPVHSADWPAELHCQARIGSPLILFTTVIKCQCSTITLYSLSFYVLAGFCVPLNAFQMQTRV